MQITKEDRPDSCEIALQIEVDPESVDKGFKRAYKEFSQVTTVPGFRPGTAPRPVLERYVNHDRLLERVREVVAVPAYKKALEQESIQPYADPSVEFGEIEEGKAWSFKAVVPTPPSVELGDLESIEVEKPIFTVSDEDIDRQIDSIRGEHGRLVNVPDRGVQAEDVVIAEMSVTVEDEEPGELKRSLIRMGNNVPGFDDALLGAKQDEEREFDLTYPEDFQDQNLGGRKAHFQVKVSSINERVLPELTDEWVKEILPFQTVEELRADIRERLDKQSAETSIRVAESRVLEQLIAKSTLKYPSVMVEEEVESDLHDLAHKLDKQGMTYEEFLESNKLTQEQYEGHLATEAQPRVKAYLVLREVAKQESVQATAQEIDSETAEVDLSGFSEIQIDRLRRRVADMVIKRKLRDILLTKATVKDVPATANSQSSN